MESEPFICRVCIKNRTSKGDDKCHPNLQPQHIDYSGNISNIQPSEKRLPVDCLRFTCSKNGKKAALSALDLKTPQQYKIYDGSFVNAVPFGSAEKPTDFKELRIVSPEGNIFSKQNGYYYPTGQNINNS